MDEKKQDQIHHLLRDNLALIIQKEFHVDPSAIVVVNRVFFEESDKLLKVFVSIFPDDKEEKILKELKNHRHLFLEQLQDKVRFSRLPKKLLFLIDEVRKHAIEVEQILDAVRQEK